MQRRDFLATTLAATAALSTTTLANAQATTTTQKNQFKLKYAPHVGHFNSVGKDPVDQIKRMADLGFTAIEDNGMPKRPVEVQEAMGKALAELNMDMGVFVVSSDFQNPTFTSGKKEYAEKALDDMKKGLEVAKRVNAKWCTVVPGTFAHNLAMGYQTANCVELLRRMCEICEPSGLIMVLEPLNHFANHPDLFLHLIPQAYEICRAVNHPSCKILFDIYHQQISEGNIIPNIDKAWSEIAYFQTGDNPGRREPGTGEINYRNIFKHLHQKGYTGVVGMEHGVSVKGDEGEAVLVQAYVDADNF